jgi:hypothetical protein
MTKPTVPDAIYACFESFNESDRNGEQANVVDGLFYIGRAIHALAKAIDRLGNADASTPMGALEAHGKFTSESLDRIADAIREHSND